MVAMDIGSFMTLDLGISLDRVVLGVVLGVLFLALYQSIVLISAMLATRSAGRTTAGPAAPANENGGTAL